MCWLGQDKPRKPHKAYLNKTPTIPKFNDRETTLLFMQEETTPQPPLDNSEETQVNANPETQEEISSGVEENAAPEISEEQSPVAESQETETVAETTEAPALEAETPSEPTSEEAQTPQDEAGDSAEPSVGFEEADAGEGVKNTLLAEILGSDEEFNAILTNSTSSELVLLMENIALQSEIKDVISRASDIQKAFKAMQGENGDGVEQPVAARFSTAYAKFNRKRKEYFDQQEKEKEENTVKKYALLEELKAIVEAEKVSAINEVREIQNKWKEIGYVLQKDFANLSQTYKHYLDIFYTLRGHYNELRDKDRQYNLDDKNRLIQEIEDMIPEEDNLSRDKWNELTNRLNSLQEIWRTTGHVPKENAEEVISRYRNALDRFFEARSGFYQEQDQQREENGTAKQALLEKLKPYADYQSDKARDWNTATNEVLAVQEEWKKIGPAPKEVNKELWKTYREICDTFFNRKGNFFKSFDDDRQANLDRKNAICEEAESLMNSEDWESTSERLKTLQSEWKEIGPVHERFSNKIWKRFRAACDHFFNARTKAGGSSGDGQKDNLGKKEDILKQMEALLASEDNADEVAEAFKNLQVDWKSTGHVPFKEKDRVNGAFKELANKLYRKLDATHGDQRRSRFEQRLGNTGGGKGRGPKGGGGNRGGQGGNEGGEIGRILRQIREAEEKVDILETNILYIAKGKKGDALRAQIQGQIDAEKGRVSEWRAKIDALRNPAPVEETAPAVEEAPVAEAPAEAPAEESTEETESGEA